MDSTRDVWLIIDLYFGLALSVILDFEPIKYNYWRLRIPKTRAA